MLLHKKNRQSFFFKSAVLVGLVFATSACTSTDVSYITREEIKGNAFTQEKPRYAAGDSRPMQLGALRMTNKDAREGDPGRILILQRKQGVYMAETKLNSESKRRYFFSLGIDPRSKAPAMGFRMEF